jgi:hypothetical protein
MTGRIALILATAAAPAPIAGAQTIPIGEAQHRDFRVSGAVTEEETHA